MTEQTFWKQFELARQQAGDSEKYREEGPHILQSLLEDLSPTEIVGFQRIFDRKFEDAYRCNLWEAADIICGSCSDDGFAYFRADLIARGKDVYEAALRDPDSLVEVVPPVERLEEWLYTASRAYEAKMSREIPCRSMGPAGEWLAEEELPTTYPRLTRKFAVCQRSSP